MSSSRSWGRRAPGKSTLLHLIGGLDRPDGAASSSLAAGSSAESERGLTELRRRHVGFVFQFFHLIPELTGEENVLLPTRLSRNGGSAPAAGAAADRRAGPGRRRAAAPCASSRAASSSGCRSPARSSTTPQLLLADEPTGNLDQESGHQVLSLLRALASGTRAVVLVTHDAEAAAIADRVLRLEAGRLVG